MLIKNKINFIIIIFTSFLFFNLNLAADEFDISAKEIIIDKENETIVGKESVQAKDSEGKIIYADKIIYKKNNDTPKQAAEDIFKNKVIAWYEGKSEIGPRALGHRSLVSNPTYKDNWKRVNKIKQREWWRPFAPSILEEEAEKWFKDMVSKAIIFKFLEKNTMKQEWYGGYRAQIIAYTIAKFYFTVRNSGSFIDFDSIWKTQSVSQTLGDALLDLSEEINYLIIQTDENVTQFCKKDTCWNFVKESNYILPDSIKADLIDQDIEFEITSNAKKKQKVLTGINMQVDVVNKGQEYWSQVYAFCNNINILSPKELSILGSTLRLDTNPPSEKQSKIILKIEQIAIDEGFYFQNV